MFIFSSFIQIVSADNSGTISPPSGVPAQPWSPITCTFKGTISLPTGEVAPSDGFFVYLRFKRLNDERNFSEITGSFTIPSDSMIIIPAGQNSVSYEKSIDINKYDTSFIPCFYTYNNASGKYSSEVIYSETLNTSNGYVFENIDVCIPFAERTISGFLTLPEDVTLSKDINIAVYAQNSTDEFFTMVTLSAGIDNVPFKFGVDKACDYKISYNVLNGAFSDAQGTFAIESCLSVKTVYLDNYGDSHVNPESFKLFDTTLTNISDVMMRMLKKTKISGIIALPNDLVAPNGGIDIYIRAFSSTTVHIPFNQNSIPYSVYIDYDTGRELFCDVVSENSHEISFVGGYYTDEGVFSNDDNDAAKIFADDGDQIINLVLNLQNDYVEVEQDNLSIIDNRLTGNISLNINNSNLNSIDAYIILGVYTTNNKLLALKSKYYTLKVGQTKVDFLNINVETTYDSDYLYKVFVWNDISTMKPFTKIIKNTILN